jgi:hypothetical protein
MDDLDPVKLTALLEEDSPTISLQAEIDRLNGRIDALGRRIANLERDREVLRERLDAARRRRFRRIEHGDPASPPTTEEAIRPFASYPIPEPDPPPGMPRIGAVLDEFSRLAFSYEAPLVHLEADRWREQVEAEPIEFLFVESVWSGPARSWNRKVARFGDPAPELAELARWGRDQGIPTVFWNKEDPANFPWFIGAARLFDRVFTVDGDAIPTYREWLGHDRIDVLPFAAQPAIHHPRPDIPRDLGVAFTGSYYAKKHAERRRQMEVVLTPVIDLGLEIWDRHAGTSDPRFAYPPHLASAVRGSLTYPETLTAHHRYKVFLNVNSVAASPTMCARRVFELLACGTPIVSGPSKAIERLFGDVVIVVEDAASAREAVSHLLAEPGENGGGPEAVRLHTYGHRLDQVLRESGVPSPGGKRNEP